MDTSTLGTTVATALSVLQIIVWGAFWTVTGVTLVASVFALLEFIVGRATGWRKPLYRGSRAWIGFPLAGLGVLGFGAFVYLSNALPGGLAEGLEALAKQDTGGAHRLVFLTAIVALAVFDIGVITGLSSDLGYES